MVYPLFMPSERLAVALRELNAGDWMLFEKFAAEFLAVEFPSLRTTASASGDKGRDGQLYVPNEDIKTVCQYSVAQDWRGKVKDTLATLAQTMPKTTRLIYCTNRAIGPAADDLIEETRRAGIALDVRDASWFVSRELTAPQRAAAAEELSHRIVDPLLAARGIGDRAGIVLSDTESRVALLHLTLDGYDQSSNKGLTKSCFESLVLAALHDTSAESILPKEVIRSEVAKLVPAGDRTQVEAQIDGALARLSARGGRIKQVGRTDNYHLSYEEQQRIGDASTRFLNLSELVENEIESALGRLGLELEGATQSEAVRLLRTALETVLLHKGEAFATAVLSGELEQMDASEVCSLLADLPNPVKSLTTDVVAEIVLYLLEDPPPAIRNHLRGLADGYTLFAFLRQTPDVQKVVIDVFSNGEIWLDTTVVLPLLAESLLTDSADRHYTALLTAAADAGFRLFVTDGVVEEVERHINKSLSFARTSTNNWTASVPFLYAGYALAGRARAGFFDWLEEFRGAQTPEEDIREYLRDEFRIESRNLRELADQASPELRAAVQAIWAAGHDQRRNAQDSDLTPASTLRLVAHDVENTVGVMQLRRQSPPSPMGYRHWFLTLDRVAFDLARLLKERLTAPEHGSPALSPDFLTELLRLGPLRSDLQRDVHVALPILTSISRYESMPKELIELADDVRRRYEGQNERVIRRRVKEAINDARWRMGAEARGGVRGAELRIKERLRAQARRGGSGQQR